MLTREIPKETTFDLPEGRYRARISNLKPFVKQAGQGPQDWLRFILEVDVPALSEKACAMAGRSFKFDLNQGSELRNWLVGLLGKDFFKERSGQQVSFDSLIGTECEVELDHFYGKGFEKPLVVVARIAPPGGLKLTPALNIGGKD